MAAKEPENEHDTIPFYPGLFGIEVYMTIGLVIVSLVVGVLGQMHPVGLGVPAEPLDTPAHIKPEWYFLGLYQAIKFVPKTAGTLLPILGMLLVMLWPFIDRRPDTSRRDRWMRLGFAAVFLVLMIVFTVWGALS